MIKLIHILKDIVTEQNNSLDEGFKNKALAATLAAAAMFGGSKIGSGLRKYDTVKVATAQDKFQDAVKSIIDNIEGAYVNPEDISNDAERKVFSNSGETMFGIDRERGDDLSKTPEGKKFWKLIDHDKEKHPKKWVRYYDGGKIKGQLQHLVSIMMKRRFERFSNAFLSEKAKQIINSDSRLYYHFVYATWNGAGWFKKFAKSIEQLIDNGVTDPDTLFDQAMQDRKNGKGTIRSRAKELKAAAESF